MKLILTAPKFLNFTAFFATLFLIVKIFWLNKVYELFDNAYELGLIVEAVLASILASYVFYLVVVHLKELNDKKLIYPLILKWSNVVVGGCIGQLDEIAKASSVSLQLENLTKKSIEDALKLLNPNHQAPLLLIYPNHYANWLQFMLYHKQRTKEYAEKVIGQMLYVESEFISKLVEVEDCSHFKQLEYIGVGPINNTDMFFMANLFYEYCVLCLELKKKIDNAKAKYG